MKSQMSILVSLGLLILVQSAVAQQPAADPLTSVYLQRNVLDQLLDPVSQPRVINGTPTNNYRSVGELLVRGSLCTATLVTPEWILTAAHCVQGATPQSTVFRLNGVNHAVCSIVIHPQWRGSDYDIAMCRLSNSISNVSPSPIQNSAPFVGQVVTIVGYGEDENGVAGIKREGQTTIDFVMPLEVAWRFDPGESNTCFGDSGGPQFNSGEAIVSITSGGTSPTCSIGDIADNTRCDVFISWMQDVIDTTPCGVGGGPCPFQLSLLSFARLLVNVDAPKSVQIVRNFRDQVLSQSKDGQRLVNLYYRHADEIKRILLANPELGLRSLQLVLTAMPEIEAAAKDGKTLALPAEVWNQGLQLLADYRALAGTELSSDLREAQNLLESHALRSGDNLRIDFRRWNAAKATGTQQLRTRRQT